MASNCSCMSIYNCIYRLIRNYNRMMLYFYLYLAYLSPVIGYISETRCGVKGCIYFAK